MQKSLNILMFHKGSFVHPTLPLQDMFCLDALHTTDTAIVMPNLFISLYMPPLSMIQSNLTQEVVAEHLLCANHGNVSLGLPSTLWVQPGWVFLSSCITVREHKVHQTQPF